jgi:2,3,4,5-tetrahydropyridine-2,6-dicarboxylate N-succinyltransferase
MSLADSITEIFSQESAASKGAARDLFAQLRTELAAGRVRVAEPDSIHLSAAAQIGGVIEPVGAMPVIVEDDVLVGGNCGVYEGAIIKRRAVLASGTMITGSTPIYDLPNERIIKPAPGQPLVVPEGAVVVPGARQVTVGAGREWGLSLATPVIVKYRDEKTDARTELERWIR